MIRSLHIVGQLEPGGVSSWLRTLVTTRNRDELEVDICANYRHGSGLLTREFTELGCRVFHIKLGSQPWNYARKLLELLSKEDYDVLHEHRSFQAGISLWCAKKSGIPARIMYHHTPNDDVSRTLVRWISSWLLKSLALRNATHIWGASNAALSALYGNSWASEHSNISVVYGAASQIHPSISARTAIREEFSIPSDAKLLCFIGRINRPKNPMGALRIACEVLGKLPKAYFMMVGDGPQLKDCIGFAESAGLLGKIRFTGFRTDIANILASVDVLLQPSLFEGLPIGTLEALSVGVPVVGSNVPGLLEALPNEMHFLCSDPEDYISHTEKVLKVLNEGPFRISAENFLKKFSPQAFATTMINRYRSAIQSSGRENC